MSVAMKSAAGGPNVSSVRLLATLGGMGALAGLLVVLAHSAATPIILANRAAVIEQAIHEVLPGIERFDTLYVHDGALTTTRPAGTDGHNADHIYAGILPDGRLAGFAIPAIEPGFQDPIEILFGFDPGSGKTLGLTIVSSRETPGLGDKIQDETWRVQFRGMLTPLEPRKRGGPPASGVQMVTGATISSRAVLSAINKNVAKWTPLIGAYTGGSRP